MLKECADCEDVKDIKMFSKDKNRTDGHYVYCKACVKIKSHERYLKNREDILEKNNIWKEENRDYYLAQQREYSKEYSQTLKGKYRQYKNGATVRNLGFDLTIEAFTAYWQLPCNYCGDEIETIGIDRIDNTKGYFGSNIVPCCEACNRAKGIGTEKDLITHCQKVVRKAAKDKKELNDSKR
jgi:hypothetical protein